MTNPLGDAEFHAIGRALVTSLQGVTWHEACLRYTMVEDGVADSTHRYREHAGGPEIDFPLVGVLAVMDAFDSLRNRIAAEGRGMITGLVFRMKRDGTFDVEFQHG